MADDEDMMANYLILSLQTDRIIPKLETLTNEDLTALEKRLEAALVDNSLTRLELFRKVAVKCEEFIIFVREKSFGEDPKSWPLKCGDIFYKTPIFTPFGTCFTSKEAIR